MANSLAALTMAAYGTRHYPVKDVLSEQLREAVTAVYGPQYRAEIMSAAQPEGPRGTPGTTGSRRHGTGVAADVWVYDPSGRRLSGDDLVPLAQHWLGTDIGSVGFPSNGQNSLHLDLVGGKGPGAVPLQKGEGRVWYYGNPTNAQRNALSASLNKGVTPQYAVSPQMVAAAAQGVPIPPSSIPQSVYSAPPPIPQAPINRSALAAIEQAAPSVQPLPAMAYSGAPAPASMPPIPREPYGMTQAGNIDLMNRPVVHNPDGSISTIRSISIGTDNGETLIPTVSPDGRILSDEDAIKLYEQSGQNLGSFRSVDAADRFAEQLHNAQAERYLPTSQTNEPPPVPADAFQRITARNNANLGIKPPTPPAAPMAEVPPIPAPRLDRPTSFFPNHDFGGVLGIVQDFSRAMNNASGPFNNGADNLLYNKMRGGDFNAPGAATAVGANGFLYAPKQGGGYINVGRAPNFGINTAAPLPSLNPTRNSDWWQQATGGSSGGGLSTYGYTGGGNLG